jgi:hypothetical protein
MPLTPSHFCLICSPTPQYGSCRFLITHPLLRTVMNSLRHVAHFTSLRIEIAATLDEARAIAYQRLREQDAALSNP